MKSVEKIVLVFFFWFSILAMFAVAQDVKSSETIASKSKPKTSLAQRKRDKGPSVLVQIFGDQSEGGN